MATPKPVHLFNTLGRRLELVQSLESGQIKLYTCGPTVYNYAQIGNLRSFIFDDVLRRTLEAAGYKVTHVMNITDVGHLSSDADEGLDKLEAGAKQEGKSPQAVAELFTGIFKSDMRALNVLAPNGYHDQTHKDTYARATSFIPQQIELVELLVERGFAYQTEQAIYFDVTKLSDYGQLTGQKLSDKEVGARPEVVTDEAKHHPYDFAVWFFTVGRFADHEMRWTSPWGEGFPGWHLECSAIIHATLGDPIDIHTGGIDHIGTHHTNEMAQTEAAYGHPLATYWVHNDFLLVDGRKMSKSLGNFYRLQDLVDKGYSPLAFRLLVLQSRYEVELNFTWLALEQAQTLLLHLTALADLQFQGKGGGSRPLSADSISAQIAALSDNLDTPRALQLFTQGLEELAANPQSWAQIAEYLKDTERLYGLGLAERSDISAEQQGIIQERETVRKAHDFAKSDQLRAELLKQGIGIDDTPDGPRWRRTSL